MTASNILVRTMEVSGISLMLRMGKEQHGKFSSALVTSGILGIRVSVCLSIGQ